MTKIINAEFDGSVFRPSEPVELPPGTEVRLTIEPLRNGLPGETPSRKPKSFLQVAREAKLEGPSDWSTNIDHYLYGLEKRDEK